MFFWDSLAFSMIQQMLAVWSQVPLPLLNTSWTSGSSRFTYLKPLLENFELCFARVWDECNHVVVWTFFGIAFFGVEWKLIFSCPVATAEFSKFAGILSGIHNTMDYQSTIKRNKLLINTTWMYLKETMWSKINRCLKDAQCRFHLYNIHKITQM